MAAGVRMERGDEGVALFPLGGRSGSYYRLCDPSMRDAEYRASASQCCSSSIAAAGPAYTAL